MEVIEKVMKSLPGVGMAADSLLCCFTAEGLETQAFKPNKFIRVNKGEDFLTSPLAAVLPELRGG